MHLHAVWQCTLEAWRYEEEELVREVAVVRSSARTWCGSSLAESIRAGNFAGCVSAPDRLHQGDQWQRADADARFRAGCYGHGAAECAHPADCSGRKRPKERHT